MTTATAPIGAEKRARVAIPFLIVTLIWSSTWLVVREQLGIVPPMWSIAYRFGIAGIVMTGYALATRQSLRFGPRQHGLALVYGVAQYCLNYLCVYVAEQTVTSGLVAVLFALLVVPNALFAWLFLKQGVSRAFLIGSGIALGGMALLFAHELAGATGSRATLALGIAWVLGGVLAASVANVVQAAPVARAIPVVSLVAWGMIWGTMVDIVLALAFDGPPVFDPSPRYWLGTLYLALFGSAVAFTLYFIVIRAIGPARAAYSGVLTPALAMALSTVFEGYRWSWEAAAGSLLALGGLAVALGARRSDARQAARP